jgi:GH43 family beta-xylosidase
MKMKKLDTFYHAYGFNHYRFIVKAANENGVFATMGSWCKSSQVYISYDELRLDKSFTMDKPYSKLRWLLKF